MAITKGSFKSLAHETKGLASIYQLADGKRTLRLTEFENFGTVLMFTSI